MNLCSRCRACTTCFCPRETSPTHCLHRLDIYGQHKGEKRAVNKGPVAECYLSWIIVYQAARKRADKSLQLFWDGVSGWQRKTCLANPGQELANVLDVERWPCSHTMTQLAIVHFAQPEVYICLWKKRKWKTCNFKSIWTQDRLF